MLDPENFVARFRGLAPRLSDCRDTAVPGVLAEVLGTLTLSRSFRRKCKTILSGSCVTTVHSVVSC
jgi:hypothetical protein